MVIMLIVLWFCIGMGLVMRWCVILLLVCLRRRFWRLLIICRVVFLLGVIRRIFWCW